jgi:Tol biopolymer transport system component
VLDDRTLIYSGTANDGSGQWLYALDVEQRIPHKVSSGIAEQYLSVTVSNTKPRRLIASVATPSATLWTVPISDRVQTEADVSRLPLPNTRAVSPSVASDYVLFLSSKGGGHGLWKLKAGKGTFVYTVPVNGGSPVRLTGTASYNPMWSPLGRFIVYSEPLQGSTFVTKAIAPDKVSVPMPDIRVSYLTSTPYRFAPDGNALIFLKEGAFVGGARNFYMMDFKTGQERQLTNLDTGFLTRSFDLMPGGRIVFDRLRENSDLAVIDLVR